MSTANHHPSSKTKLRFASILTSRIAKPNFPFTASPADLATILGLFIGWRAATWVFGILAASSVEGIPPPLSAVDFLARASLQGEALWHIWLAQGGYGSTDHDPRIAAFPPMFAFLTQLLQRVVGSWSLAGGIVAHTALVAALAYLLALARLDCADHDGQLRTIAAALLWPAAPFLGVVYPEGLLLLTITAALYHARRGQWWAAGLWGVLAGLTRGFGLLLIIPLLFEWYDRPRRAVGGSRQRLAGFFAVIAAPLGFMTFLTLLAIQTGSPLTYFRAQAALGPGSLLGALGLRTLLDMPAILTDAAPAIRGYTVEALPFPTALIPAIIDLSVLITATCVGLWLLRGRRSYGLFVLAGVLAVALLYGLPDSSRHLLGLAPIYLTLGRWTRYPIGGYLSATLGIALIALTIFLQVNGFGAG